MCLENQQTQDEGTCDLQPYVNDEPISKLVLGAVGDDFGMVWDPQYRYQIKVKPSDWVEIIALDILTPDEPNVPKNCSLILPSGVSVDFVSCRQTDEDDEIQQVSLPKRDNGYPEVLIEPGTTAIISVTTSEPMWRGRAVRGEEIGPIQVINDESSPVQFQVKCTVPKFGDALCPVLNIYYKKGFDPKPRHDSDHEQTQADVL